MVLSWRLYAYGNLLPASCRSGIRSAGSGTEHRPQVGAGSPVLPQGAQFVVLQGDPSKEGIYNVRLQMPAGYFIAPHFHPTDEHVTILSGALRLGMGDMEDSTTAMTFKNGGFITAGANMHHFARAMEPTVVQVHGMGPFAITYVDPKNDPRNATAGQ